MLVALRLQNIALLESVDLVFEKGLTVLTGETGAGKSILLDALDALFRGNQATSLVRLVRSGAQKACIEASFLSNSKIDSWLKSEGFDLEDNELLIARELRFHGDRLVNRCRLNGVLINRNQLLDLRPLLIDITVQGQNLQFDSPAAQLNWLDQLGCSNLADTLEKVKHSWLSWKKDVEDLEQAKLQRDQISQKSKELDGILNELNLADINSSDEDITLEIEQDRLVNVVRLEQGLNNLFILLQDGTDQLPSVDDQLGDCINELKCMTQIDQSLSNRYCEISNLQTCLQEFVVQLQKYSFALDSDPSRLDQIQERLSLLKNLQRKHGKTLSQLLEYKNKLALSQSSNEIDELILRLQKNEQISLRERDKQNEFLTALRKNIAHKLEIDLIEYMNLLGLPHVRFRIQFDCIEPNRFGADKVCFLFSANAGEPLAPLVEVASGGEMSRFLLALKTVLSNFQGSTTLVFDEIDSGVSGRISDAIACVLKDLSLNRQVFCVTHQPLVAARADHHFRVFKSVSNGKTYSQISKLSKFQERQHELASLAGGDFDEANAYAASLLEQRAA